MHKHSHTYVLAGLLTLTAATMFAQQEPAATPPAQPPAGETPAKERARHPILCYIPNRIFDVLDIVRARVRLGPGLSLGARVTEAADVFLGAHKTAYVGLRGSRGKAQVPWPLGVECNQGLEFSVADGTAEDPDKPVTDPLEVGVEAQVLLVGVNVSVETLEIVDLLAGFIFLDLRDDDY
jgi:hypothetical protein